MMLFYIYLFIYLLGANRGKIDFTDDMCECIDQWIFGEKY